MCVNHLMFLFAEDAMQRLHVALLFVAHVNVVALDPGTGMVKVSL